MSREMTYRRIVVAMAGLAGAAAAAASHAGESRNLAAIAAIGLAHGPALLALGLAAPPGRMLRAATILLALGTLVFAGDLGAREWMGQGMFPGAAPLGGGAMIAGWCAIVLAAATGKIWFKES